MKHLLVMLLTLNIFQAYDNYRLREYNNFLEANYNATTEIRKLHERAGALEYNSALAFLPYIYIAKETATRLDSTYSLLKDFDREQLVAYFSSNDTSMGNQN
jgi:hypothetical protein